jgi:hypothetical protein
MAMPMAFEFGSGQNTCPAVNVPSVAMSLISQYRCVSVTLACFGSGQHLPCRERT